MAFVAIPSATDIITQVGSTSSPMFNELLPIGLTVTGFIVGGLVVAFLIIAIPRAFSDIIDKMQGKSPYG